MVGDVGEERRRNGKGAECRHKKPGAVAGLDLLTYFLDHIVTTGSIYSLIINFRNTSS